MPTDCRLALCISPERNYPRLFMPRLSVPVTVCGEPDLSVGMFTRHNATKERKRRISKGEELPRCAAYDAGGSRSGTRQPGIPTIFGMERNLSSRCDNQSLCFSVSRFLMTIYVTATLDIADRAMPETCARDMFVGTRCLTCTVLRADVSFTIP